MLFFKKFASSETGAAFLPFAISFFVILAVVGMAIDIARLHAVRVVAQDAVDSAVLGAAIVGGTQGGQSYMQEAEELFITNYPANYLGSTITRLQFNKQVFPPSYFNEDGSGGDLQGDLDSGKYDGLAEIRVPSTIMQVFGTEYTTITVRATAVNNIDENQVRAEIAIVLDITGSMLGQKIADLKQASHLVVELLFGGEEHVENLYISLIPYNVSVVFNHSEFPQSRNWIQTNWLPRYDAQIAAQGKAFIGNRNNDNLINTASDFTTAKPLTEDTKFRTPTSQVPGAPGILFNPLNTYETIGACQDLETANIAPMIFAQNTQAPIHSRIDQMEADGCTRINVGALWGWLALSPSWQGVWDPGRAHLPLTVANDVRRYMIIMTDGNNTVYKAQQPNISSDDASLTTICTTAKASGIEIYTITLGPHINQALMEGCATDSSHYFHAPTSGELSSVFEAIAMSILSEYILLTK